MHATLRNGLLVFFAGVIALAMLQRANSEPKRQYKRVKPDTSKVDTSGIFFDDIFSQGLRGERPANLSSSGGTARPPIQPPSGGIPAPLPNGVGAWEQMISVQTLEDEIKRTKLEIAKNVITPTTFNSLGHKKCREHFSSLGMLFAIVHEYSGDVRWKDEAAVARDLFGRAGRNCKSATLASYNNSKRRSQDLSDMLNGSALDSAGEAAEEVDWSLVCERSQLMKRIEQSTSRLREYTASASVFKSSTDEAKHEAEMLSAISLAIQQNGMPDCEDDDYAAFCDTMKDSARAIVDAAELGNNDAASKAMGNITRACNECHETYRG